MDDHLRQIESRLEVEINNRGNHFRVIGNQQSVDLANKALSRLYESTSSERLSSEKIHLYFQEEKLDDEVIAESIKDVNINTKFGVIKGRGTNQRLYLSNIQSYDISFGIGPAGTGKTYLAVASAVSALDSEKVRRIVLVRPAVEAGEKLGYLPGDIVQKVDPYLRPLYDALFEMLGVERVNKLIERNIIEVAPLAFMRGRTLNESFVILDEAQNTTVEQMKMFLTRTGSSSTAVITGDITQIDLPHGKISGLKHVIQILDDEPGISFTFFKSKDVVRHPLVTRILNAYERYENASKNNK
ncbi:MAG: phosphate starvation-inducible PhoH-like protein [Gammaproteobacteria bacterium]|jgi:phosphate starvation-inducible PhoH-like protein